MSRRAQAEVWRKEQAAPRPLQVTWSEPEPMRAPAGHCPRCGVFVGRAIRGHTKTCEGKREA